jgi:hypothetical protein
MNLEPAQPQDVLIIIDILKQCNQNLLSQGIYQWDEKYPSKELIEQNITAKAFLYIETIKLSLLVLP